MAPTQHAYAHDTLGEKIIIEVTKNYFVGMVKILIHKKHIGPKKHFILILISFSRLVVAFFMNGTVHKIKRQKQFLFVEVSLRRCTECN